MQFVHKLVRLYAQCVGVVGHTAQALHQLADFGFIAEGGDGANHLALDDHRHGIGQKLAAVKTDLLVA
ncbi:hypothetical protein D3C71_2114670 [compost metagenome]